MCICMRLHTHGDTYTHTHKHTCYIFLIVVLMCIIFKSLKKPLDGTELKLSEQDNSSAL